MPTCCIRQNLRNDREPCVVAAYGPERVRVTPISETAEIGIAVGVAMAGSAGCRAVHGEFMLVAMDQVVNEAPRFRLHDRRTGRGPVGTQGRLRIYRRLGGPHTGSLTALFMGFRDSKWWCPPPPPTPRA